MPDTPDWTGSVIENRYYIERLIAAGGMAEVYLALDKRHHRRVAIKMLHAELASTVATERFQREIVTTARLQHPNILPLFDSGEVNGRLYYVMPYIQGESLRNRLDRERLLPIEEAVRIAAAIADALQHAHDQGVVHRDIKPENILLQGEYVLVADFGVSLALEKAAIGRLTRTGVSLGTPQYMSPEQAAGDLRITSKSDVYSVAAVLYEMLTGEPPFGGTSAAAITSRIISATPHPPSALRSTISAQLEREVLRALSKAPPDRPSAREFANALRGQSKSAIATPRGSRRSARRFWIPAVGIAAALVVTMPAALTREDENEPDPIWLSFTPQADAPLVATTRGPLVAISPDGKQLVYVGPSKTTRHGTQLYLRDLDSRKTVPIAGTDSGFGPVFSPDGGSIAFHGARGKLRRVSLTGSRAVELLRGGVVGSAVWSDDGFLIYFNGVGIRRLPERGGDPQAFIVRDSALGNAPAVFSALPQRKGVLFKRCTASGCRLAVATAATQTVKELGYEATGAWYLPTGHLLYLRGDGVLLAVPFDLATLTVRGDPKEVLPSVSTMGGTPQLFWSRSGTMAMLTEGVRTSHMMIFSPQAEIADVVLEHPGRLERPNVSPNGRHVALTVSSAMTPRSGISDLFTNGVDSYIGVFDVVSRTLRRMSQEAGATGASWSPSGDLLAYVAGAGQNGQLIVKDAAKGALSREISVSPYYLLGMRRNRIAWESESRLKLIAYPRASGGEAMRISVPVDGSEPARQVSSRGSDLTVDGPWRVSVRPTGSEFNEWRVELGLPRDQSSADSHELQKNMILGTGGPPFWHPSRSELYFRTADSLYVVRVPAQGSTGISRNAFPLGRPFPPPSMSAPDFDVFPDGRRFVMIKHGDPVVEIQVALNWFEQLKTTLRQ